MRPIRVPLAVQVGAVGALFAASLVALWMTGAAVLEREARRASARGDLARAGDELAARGAGALATIAPFPLMDEEGWDALDLRLAGEAALVLAPFRGVEGGSYVRRGGGRFLGFAFPTAPIPPPAAKAKAAAEARGRSSPPPREADIIETLVDAAIRKERAAFVVVEVPPSTVAIRAAPIRAGERIVGATWTMTRLVDPVFLARSTRGFWIAAGLALAGIALALALTVSLARTVTAQARERDRLQTNLRRSERLAALGKLLAGVAHEVRNPLAGIRSTVQLWQRGIGRDDDDALAGLVEEVDRLEGLISRLLQFSRADAQDLAPGDLNAVVAEVARLTAPRAEAQGVGLEVELDPGLPPADLAAPALIQVFRNLATNALQAMPAGGTLRLETGRAAGRGAIEARVADTGPGLSAEAASHLFEPFFTTKADGTGLGLAIAREIALAHRGDLRAEDRTDGPGALFILTLPVAEPGAIAVADANGRSPGAMLTSS